MDTFMLKILFVFYTGTGNKLVNMTNNIFTIFREDTTVRPKEGFYLASIIRQTKDKSDNDMYIVDLKAELPSYYIQGNSDNTEFLQVKELISKQKVTINVYFMRLLNAIINRKFAEGLFDDIKSMKILYNNIVSGQMSNTTLYELNKIFKRVQLIVLKDAKKYFPELVLAVGTKQSTNNIPFYIDDINHELSNYIGKEWIHYILIPVVYDNMEKSVLTLEEIIDNGLCKNYYFSIFKFGEKLLFKFTDVQKCG